MIPFCLVLPANAITRVSIGKSFIFANVFNSLRFYPLHLDPLHLIEAEILAPAIVELRRAHAGMVGHLRRLLKRALVSKMRRDTRRLEVVIAKLGRDADSGSPRAGHRMSVRLEEGPARHLSGAGADRPKQRPPRPSFLLCHYFKCLIYKENS